MRLVASIAAYLAAGAVLALSGCRGPSAPPPHELVPARPAAAGARIPPDAPLMFHLRVVRLHHRVRADAPIEDIWRLLGTTSAPYEKRALCEVNDLRFGDGGRLAADRMNELAADTADHTAQTTSVLVRENMDFFLSLGAERESLDLVWTEAGGKLVGRRFDTAFPGLRVVCRSDPEDPAGARIAFAPEVLYGPETMRWVRNEAGTFSPQLARSSFLPGDLAAEVRLAASRMLVIGGRRGSDLSLGGAMFNEKRGPDLWAQTIVLTAERVQPDRKPAMAAPALLPAFVPRVPEPAPPAKPAPPMRPAE